MSEENRQTPEETLSARLQELEDAKAGKTKSGKRRSPAILITGLLGLVTLCTAGYLLLQDRQNGNRLEAGNGDDFQTLPGTAYGEMPAPQQVFVERKTPFADDSQTQKLIEELRKQLVGLKKKLAKRSDEKPGDDPRVQALSDELKRLKAAEAERDAEMERFLRKKKLELQKLQSQLDMARLNGGQNLDNRAHTSFDPQQRSREIQENRIKSSMIAYGGSNGENKKDGDEQAKAKLTSNESFVRDSGLPTPVERAKIIVNPSYTVTQGTMIQAILETAIDSTLPGAIRAVVGEDVHSFDGRRTLIPRGARIIGKYSEEITLGQKRALVAWRRIIMPDNQSVTISAYGGDELGQSGMTGKVNTHFTERFGSAALISLISVIPALTANETSNDTASDITGRVGQNLQSATQNVIGDYLKIKPTIHVNQGSRVTIMVDRDLEIF